MFVGHLGAGLALKRAEKSINPGVLFGTALFVDALLAVLILLGVEHVTAPADYAGKHYLTFMFPFSHGLIVNIMWSALAFLVYRIFTRSRTNTKRYSAIVALAVFSHFVLDVIVHVPDMPVLGQDSIKLGFGLWEYLLWALLSEVSIACLGLYIYLKTVPLSRMKQVILIAVIVLLSGLIVAGQSFAPSPPQPETLAGSLIIQTAILVAFGYWSDRNRSV